ncbi:MAG: type II toxin-antitoxin system death-on-curing family toxin [Candidatus Levybacteria bacterium]|nr:type II toxin-antitoxin system death-on-curing family toxin [Candidatus Levybacteria bacterium]
MKGIIYITLDVVLAIHDDMVERYGGSHGIRDLGLIQSALARPQASFGGEDLYPTILDKAAALFHSLIFNHAFTDGNKRTSITTTARFLYINGYEFKVDKKEFIDFPLRVENKHLAIEEIAKWLKTHTRKRK